MKHFQGKLSVRMLLIGQFFPEPRATSPDLQSDMNQEDAVKNKVATFLTFIFLTFP